MNTVTVSTKFQIVIPKEIRNTLNIRPGQKIQILPYKGRMEFMLVKNAIDMRGVLAGIETDIARDEDRL